MYELRVGDEVCVAKTWTGKVAEVEGKRFRIMPSGGGGPLGFFFDSPDQTVVITKAAPLSDGDKLVAIAVLLSEELDDDATEGISCAGPNLTTKGCYAESLASKIRAVLSA
jgi:hypothetical protein